MKTVVESKSVRVFFLGKRAQILVGFSALFQDNLAARRFINISFGLKHKNGVYTRKSYIYTIFVLEAERDIHRGALNSLQQLSSFFFQTFHIM